MDVWKTSAGLNLTVNVTFCDGDGNPIAFGGAEALSGTVWAGGSLAPLFTLTPIWVTPGSGVVGVTVPAANTQTLEPATYRVILTVVVNGLAVDAYEAALEVTYAPGSTPAKPTYITVEDLRGVADWIDTIQNLPAGKAGFVDQCADARDWLDQNILRNCRGTGIRVLGWHQVALDSWFTGGARRTSLDNLYIRQMLANNTLMLTPPIKKAQAYYACALICERMITLGKEWATRHAYYQAKAYQVLASTVAQLDVNNDGNPEIPINFSSVNTLYS